MSDADDIEEIRRRKRKRLEKQLDGDGEADGETEDAPSTPETPVFVEGEDHLRSILSDHRVVLVDFFAEWCGPCKMLDPIVEEIATDTGATVAKVDIDAHQSLAGRYGVRGVPTLVLCVDGDPVERLVGMQDKETLVGLVEGHV